MRFTFQAIFPYHGRMSLEIGRAFSFQRKKFIESFEKKYYSVPDFKISEHRQYHIETGWRVVFL